MSNVRPFVIKADTGIDGDGNRGIVLGVEFGFCAEDAWRLAIRRWPESIIFDPEDWNGASFEDRMEALKADRGESMYEEAKIF